MLDTPNRRRRSARGNATPEVEDDVDTESPATEVGPDEMVLNAVEETASEEELISALVRRGVSERASLQVELSEEEEQFLVNRVIRDFEDAESGMGEFKDRHREYVEAWRGVVTSKTFPFEGAANVRNPLTQTTIEQFKARCLKGLLGGKRVVQFSVLNEAVPQEDLDDLNDWFHWELDEVVGLEKHVQDVLHTVGVDGIGLSVPRYAHEEKTLVSIREFEIAEGASLRDQMLTALQQVFEGEEADPRSTGLGKFDVTFRRREDKEKHEAHAEFSIVNEKLVACVERPEVVFDGVVLESINLEDLVVINSANDIEDLPFFGSRIFISVMDFLNGVRGGKFRDFSDEELDQIKSGASNKQSDFIQQDTTDMSDREEGTQSKDITGVDVYRQWLEIYRWEGLWSPLLTKHLAQSGHEVDDSAEAFGVCVWVEQRSRRIIRVVRLEEINKDGKRSPTKWDCIVQPDRFFSVGLVEWLRHIQDELNGIHNQRLDAGLLSNVPFGFYSPTAGMGQIILQLEPGKMYPVRDPSSVSFPSINWQPLWSFQEEQNVKRYGQELVGLSDPSMGSFLSKRTSASEFMGTAAANDLRTEYILKGLARSLRHLLYRILGLYQQYMPDGRVFQVTSLSGERLVKKFKKDRLHGKIVLHLTANVQQMSAQLERDVATNMLSLLLNGLLIQLGIVKADTVYAALEKVIRASDYNGVPIHKPDVAPESLPPDVEHKRMMLGYPVHPTPNENFNEHLSAHSQLASNPMVDQFLPSMESKQALAAHIQETMQMQKLVEMVKAVQMQQAAAMQGSMETQGIRPGKVGGSQPGDNAGPGTQEEGVAGGPTEGGLQ